MRVTYLNNKTRGQWKAHGRYLARESALRSDGEGAGFRHGNERVDVASKLETWQKAGDQRVWKLIVSPELGEKVDLTQLTRELMERMMQDLGTALEWAAVEHYNTEHPHVHVILRGLRDDGEALRISRQYVQQGIRHIAEDLCTHQLGYRTQLDAVEAERREIVEKRFTSLDRRIMRETSNLNSEPGQPYFVVRNPIPGTSSEAARLHVKHEAARLAVLQKMGLAESTGTGTWLIRRDFEQILRAMQRAADHQKTLAAQGALISDERLPVEVLDLSRMSAVEGRVLVHGEDEQSGRNYLMLEATDAKVYFVQYTPDIEQARSRGELQVNSFVHLQMLSGNGFSELDVEDLGNAEGLLSNRRYLTKAAGKLLNRGIAPAEDGWGGWLGRYQAALAKTAINMTQGPDAALGRKHEPKRDRSFGR